MTRFRTRLARLEGPKKRRVVFYVIDSFEEAGPVIGAAMVDGVVYRRHDGESEETFKSRIEGSIRPTRSSTATPKARDRRDVFQNQ